MSPAVASGLGRDLAGGMKGRIFQTVGRADCKLEEGGARVCLVHWCAPTPDTELEPGEYLWRGDEGGEAGYF